MQGPSAGTPLERSRPRNPLFGEAMTWVMGGALTFDLLLVLGMLGLIAYHGLGHFWQAPLVQLELDDGTVVLGEVHGAEESQAGEPRIRIKSGNRDIRGLDFQWIDESRIQQRSYPARAVLLERLEWGNFYGYAVELRRGEEVLASGDEEVWAALPALHRAKLAERRAIRELEADEIGDVNWEIERIRLAERRLELEHGDEARARPEWADLQAELARRNARYATLAEELGERNARLQGEALVMRTADGIQAEIPVGQIVRALQPNALDGLGKLGLYASRIGEFLGDDPRESNTEGGIFPAIFGTVMMVFLTSLAVAPFGVLAALYLREYARPGPVVRVVRIAVNNLAGVPSIVFGIFGLGFFVYFVGGTIDQLFYPERLPSPTFGTGGILWASLTLALLTVPVVIVATEEGLAAVPRAVREGSLALGATKFETLRRVVLPAAAPGVLTGLILAMARAAGEVAPLMIVGMVKLAPTLPVDGHFPFVHLERKFMHLGFHIYDVGFQSPNVEAVVPLVYATALLLILVVLSTNLTAILLRNHLRRKYTTSAV